MIMNTWWVSWFRRRPKLTAASYIETSPPDGAGGVHTERRRLGNDLQCFLPLSNLCWVFASDAFFCSKTWPPITAALVPSKVTLLQKMSGMIIGHLPLYTSPGAKDEVKLEVELIISNLLESQFLSPSKVFLRGSETISLPYIPPFMIHPYPTASY